MDDGCLVKFLNAKDDGSFFFPVNDCEYFVLSADMKKISVVENKKTRKRISYIIDSL